MRANCLLLLALLLFAAPVAGQGFFERPSYAPTANCLARGGSDEVCELAERISRLGTCTTPESCLAYQAWQRLFGAPEAIEAEPREGELPSVEAEPVGATRSLRGLWQALRGEAASADPDEAAPDGPETEALTEREPAAESDPG